jgi:hypothetical protein
MDAFVKIGTDEEAINAVKETIMAILDTNNDQLTKQIAIKTMSELCSTGNSAFSNCNFINEAKPKKIGKEQK